MKELVIRSFAKINWVLEILSKRFDGYHNISSIFDLLPIFDTIKLKLIENSKWDIKISCNIKQLEKKNILYKLVDILNVLDTFNKYEIILNLEKRIPVGGGLGGGSSNAASLVFFCTKEN